MIRLKDQCILITSQKKQRKFYYSEILSISHRAGVTIFHMKKGKDHRVSIPFKDCMRALSKNGFGRSDRCQMINLRYIEMIDSYSRIVHLVTGEMLKISRRCLKPLQESWGNL